MHRNLRLVRNYYTLCVKRGLELQTRNTSGITWRRVSLDHKPAKRKGINRFDKQIRLNRTQEV